MRDIILKLVKNREDLSLALVDIGISELEKGQLSIGNRFVTAILGLIEGDKVKVRAVEITADGVTASIDYDRMALEYYLQIKKLSVSGGRLDGDIAYREKRQGGGIGNALLGLTGKSGIAVALGRKRWCRVDNSTIFLESMNMPGDLYLRYLGIKQGRLLFKIN